MLHLAAGDTLSALRHLKQSLDLSPHQAIYNIMYGIASKDDSHQRFVHAVYYSPDLLDSQWFRDLYAKDSIWASSIVTDAETMLSETISCRAKDYLLQARLSKVLIHKGKTSVAEKMLYEVTQAMPNMNRPWMMLGDIAFARNDSVALRYFERAMQLDPLDALAKARIGDWHLQHDNLLKAFDYYIDALRLSFLSQTEHSRRCLSLYRTPTLTNDVVPPAFFRYIRPFVDTQKLAVVIAQGYEMEGNAKKTAKFRQLADGEIGVQEAFR